MFLSVIVTMLIGGAVFALLFPLANKIFPIPITPKSIAIMVVINVGVMGGAHYLDYYSKGADFQVLNGEVTRKAKERTSCTHSYSCNCRTVCSGSGSTQSCSTSCDTCYEHDHDYDWVVYTSVGEIHIDRVDSQGARTPPRWDKASIGEPASIKDSYYNYIKANPTSIFNTADMKTVGAVPGYPVHVHDYYRVNRVLNFGSEFSPDRRLNDLLNEGLRKLGPSKRVNIGVIFHKEDNSFIERVRVSHLGGKVNDVYVFINVDSDGNIRDAGAFSWSRNDMVNVTIRDDLLDLGTYDSDNVANVILTNTQKYFDHRSIKEFEYLASGVSLSTTTVAILITFGLTGPFILCFLYNRMEKPRNFRVRRKSRFNIKRPTLMKRKRKH